MSFELPDLDSRSGAQLLAELTRRIPMFTSKWTDFNDSDPGVTLLQLLCWVGESLLYQANALPIETQRNFLRLVLGLAFSTNSTAYSLAAEKNNDFAFLALRRVLAAIEAGQPLSRDDIQAAVLEYRRVPYAALTLADTQRIALETNVVIAAMSPATPPRLNVARADAGAGGDAITVHILSDAAQVYVKPIAGNVTRPDGSARRVLLYQGAAAADPGTPLNTLLGQVRTHLAPRVLAGSRVNVAAARMTFINLRLSAECPPAIKPDNVLDGLASALFAYFQPGPAWTYGQPPDLAEVLHVAASVPGVGRITACDLNYVPTPRLGAMAELGVNARLAGLPAAPPALIYQGLPRLRCLDLSVRSAQS